ncbi:isoleucyl-tRNA synthetase [Breznakia blatticola]|uniref:Isoleucine--tRNA ligase n=1 Tax=Breznakia blatticola TaxID=1754012 RepID=A0A4R7ZG30_9FIRM|nr:isoleucine--tRNA ligase [Breznakia blatticola]TDW16623.1 isoleucyl-tRNA synthetase [Breznakia blatticola]
MEYKDTLLMPKTDFEMRGNLVKKEPGIQQRWEDEKLYEQMLAKRDGSELFVLHDGPPYANGDIHLGHALNKTLKDVIVRARFMQGYKTPFIPGWDTHGLPIETAIQKQGYNRKEMKVEDFRKICHDYALEQVKIQEKGFKSLGCIGDYDHPYITLQKEFEKDQIKIFGKMATDGLIYQGKKPVYWSPSSETALAEAEIEYKDIKSPAIYVKFNVLDGKGILDEKVDAFVIWTTTPWTLPANLAICLNPFLEYALVESEKGNLVVLASNVDTLWEELGLEEKKILKTFRGEHLEGITAQHPFYDRESLVICGQHVTEDAGTGCVHTAPGHGEDDFIVGMKYGLPPYCPVDEQGHMMAEAGSWLEGLYVDDANKVVTQKLEEVGALLKLEFITHSYPHDWRTKKPIIFRATKQWFASIDKIRDQLLEEVANVFWTPTWGEQRLHNMIRDRGDWCISRQRAWGVPIPIIYAEDGTPIMEHDLFEHFAALIGEFGTNVWFERDAKDLLPEGYTHPGSPNGEFTKEVDTMDVWFDSGSSHTEAMIGRGLPYPADLYFEGSDQYRGWFNSSLIIGTAVYGHAPYKQILSHGFVMDEKGVKMSKSQWNAVAPTKITQQYGADILRLWATTVDYQQDVSMGDAILKQVSEQYRKVRNTFRFILGNINPADFGQADMVPEDKLTLVDKHMLVLLSELNHEVKELYVKFDFSTITSKLTTFMTNMLSAYYLDFTKDILYIEKKDDTRRRQVQTVLYKACDTLLKLWSPILVHTAEEISDHFAAYEGTVHLTAFNKSERIADDEVIKEKMNRLFAIRKDVFKAIEQTRNDKVIGKPLEAHVILHAKDTDKALLEEVLGDKIHQWLTVSKVSFTEDELEAFEVIEVKVEKCEGSVCPRCWNITDSHAEDGLCERCASVLEK